VVAGSNPASPTKSSFSVELQEQDGAKGPRSQKLGTSQMRSMAHCLSRVAYRK